MSTEENKAIVNRLIKSYNERSDATANEVLAEAYVRHLAGAPDTSGRDAFLDLVKYLLTIFPDHHINVEEILAEGDRVVTRITVRATHATTGKQARWAGMMMFRFAEGRIVEEWAVEDFLSQQQQFGLIPT